LVGTPIDRCCNSCIIHASLKKTQGIMHLEFRRIDEIPNCKIIRQHQALFNDQSACRKGGRSR
jgi:hypothetical protein